MNDFNHTGNNHNNNEGRNLWDNTGAQTPL